MAFINIQTHSFEFLLQLPGGFAAAVRKEQVLFIFTVQPFNKIFDAWQKVITLENAPVSSAAAIYPTHFYTCAAIKKLPATILGEVV